MIGPISSLFTGEVKTRTVGSGSTKAFQQRWAKHLCWCVLTQPAKVWRPAIKSRQKVDGRCTNIVCWDCGGLLLERVSVLSRDALDHQMLPFSQSAAASETVWLQPAAASYECVSVWEEVVKHSFLDSEWLGFVRPTIYHLTQFVPNGTVEVCWSLYQHLRVILSLQLT